MTFLTEHLNVSWLRPESALWDAIASEVIAKTNLDPPVLDLGCGDGIFSFITQGGTLAETVDRYVDPVTIETGIRHRPEKTFSCGLDGNEASLAIARQLGFYHTTTRHTIRNKLPFPDETFQSVFSNILYWLDYPKSILMEINRVLISNGKAVFCVPNENFFNYCKSYRWSHYKDDATSAVMHYLNQGREKDIKWRPTGEELHETIDEAGFIVEHDTAYLSQPVLTFWDTGLRPIFPYLKRLVTEVNPEVRFTVKKAWVESVYDMLAWMLVLEDQQHSTGGFNCLELKKE
jgi:SAM-dependent methyltransferase